MFNHYNIVRIHSIPSLMSWWDCGVQLNSMLNNVWGNFGQFLGRPCKQVFVFLQQCFNFTSYYIIKITLSFKKKNYFLKPKFKSCTYISSNKFQHAIFISWTLMHNWSDIMDVISWTLQAWVWTNEHEQGSRTRFLKKYSSHVIRYLKNISSHLRHNIWWHGRIFYHVLWMNDICGWKIIVDELFHDHLQQDTF
jgi:hypothetical protein